MAGIRKRKGEILVKLANTGELIPVALYIRVSSIGQDVENSVDSQLQLLKQWATENGYVIVKIFIDEAKSGRSGNRPNFQELIREGGRTSLLLRECSGIQVLPLLPGLGRKRLLQSSPEKEGDSGHLDQ